MAIFSLRNFRTEVARRNLARPTRFEVMIPVPNAIADAFTSKQNELVSLFCESTALPPQIVGVRQQRIYGPTYPRPFGVEYGGEGLPMSFYLDQQMDVKAFFDAWISKVVDPKQFFVYYPRDYTVDIMLYQLNERNEPTYAVTLESAFPRSVTLIELNHGTTNQVSRISVNFAFRKWVPSHQTLARVKYPPVNRAEQTAPQITTVQTWNKNVAEIKPQINGFDPNELLGPF